MASSARPIPELIERAITALHDLATLGEEVDDEWSYVNDLDAAWTERLTELADRRRDELVDLPVVAAIDEAIRETEAITDPHRAIDWQSTFPQVVLVALGEPD
jgi:hypothetical protein